MSRPIILAPSILSADFAQLGQQVEEAANAGAKYIHIDVMDGHFVPNITIGPLLVKALRPITDKTSVVLDVHLMIENPAQYVEAFATAGADIITIHVEADNHLHRTVQMIHELGVKAGVTLNPATPVSSLEEILPLVELVLIMSVNPGFAGQSYIESSTAKIRRVREMLDVIGSSADLEVDGGVKLHNAKEIVDAGVNVLVAGSAVFGGEKTITENIADFKAVLGI
jgi:ribulose-phosphate 3-epimerase